MGDQFDEWDKFYERYQRSLTAEGAFKKYRRKRKRDGKVPPWMLSPEERLRHEYEKRVEKRRVESLKARADELARESALRASKNTTQG